MEKIRIKTSAAFNAVYDIGIIVKGFDGIVEFIAGLALLVSPGLVHSLLMAIGAEASEGHGRMHHFVAQYVARLDDQLAASGLVFLVIFLLSHGLVKIVLVVCLLKKIVRVYPGALAILSAFLIYQLYVFLRDPGIGMALFCILDVAIIWLVWREYRVLLQEKVV
jgi:uncharacterized membrane protein